MLARRAFPLFRPKAGGLGAEWALVRPMPDSQPRPITELLDAHCAGDSSALDRLLPLVYDELHGLARMAFRNRQAGHTLQPTAVIHEAWLKLSAGLGEMNDRHHFFAVATRAIRQVLANHARSLRTRKRDGERKSITLVGLADSAGETDVDLVMLDDSLRRLSKLNERHGRVVELRFLGGLTVGETAEVLGVSERTVESDWAMARAWLGRELRPA